MVYTLRCKTCDRVLGTVVEVRHLEIPCPQCKQTTTFSIYTSGGKQNLAAIHVPRTDPRTPKTTEEVLRSNRYVDSWKC